MDIICSQFKKLPYPDTNCSGKTVIITGANTGLGKEAARHFVRLDAKVILAVRSITKGEEAKRDIESTTKRTGTMEIWEVDLASYSSVKAFGKRISLLPRVDIVIMNASIATYSFAIAEDNESSITVNVISTFLLVVSLLPTLRTFAATWSILPVITIISSDMHHFTTFPERLMPSVLAALNEKPSNMNERYATSKLLQVLAFHEISSRLADKQPMVVLNMVNPGLCKTSLRKNTTGVLKVQAGVLQALVARTAEVGSRTLFHGGTAGTESYGRYISDCNVNKNTLSPFVKSSDGHTTQKKFWKELVDQLDKIDLGLVARAGL